MVVVGGGELSGTSKSDLSKSDFSSWANPNRVSANYGHVLFHLRTQIDECFKRGEGVVVLGTGHVIPCLSPLILRPIEYLELNSGTLGPP